MKKSHLVRIILILAVTALAVWYLVPTFTFYSKPAEVRKELLQDNPKLIKKVVNLGLDLQGGMLLVMEIDKSNLSKDAQKDAVDRAYTIIENRINAWGVAEPDIKKMGTDRISVELPGLSDPKIARELIGSTAQLKFNLLRDMTDYGRAIRVINDALKGTMPIDSTAATIDSTAKENKEAQETAKQLFEGSEGAKDSAQVADTGKGAVSDTAAAGTDGSSFSDMLIPIDQSSFGAAESDIPKIKALLERENVKTALRKAGLGGSAFLWSHDKVVKGSTNYRTLYMVRDRAEMLGDIIKDATASIAQGGMDAGQWKVDMEMNSKGASQFSRVTGANIGKNLAIVLDSSVFSAPVIRTKIPHGQAEISGNFTAEEAKALAVVLRAGALPAPVKIIEERTVGPSLGDDSIKKGATASIASLLLIMLFMVAYYKVSGMLANLALVLNIVFLVAIMASINATFTLPGIAGLILTIGMAVDANVLIFERIREELDVGKTVRSALESGYTRVFITILDSNLTTILTGLILLWVGSGMLKGFAITLIIGICVSMFTALFVTKVLQQIILESSKSNKISV
jgi:protein-export membrane protein SecD